MSRLPWIFIALSIFAALLSLNTPASADAGPYLRATPAFDVFYTYDVLTVDIEGRAWSNDTGNLTLIPQTAWLNATLYDVNHDVIVDQTDILMWSGNATYRVTVDPVWTSTILNLSVYDFGNGLEAHVRLRTMESAGYLRWLDEQGRARDRAAIQADADSKLATVTLWESLAFASLVSTFAFLFLREDHKRSVLAGVESYWERFAARVWPYGWLPEDPFWLDPEAAEAYDKPAALFFRWSRQQGAFNRWRDLRDEIDASFRTHEPPPPAPPKTEPEAMPT